MGLPLRLPQKKQILCGCPVQKKAFVPIFGVSLCDKTFTSLIFPSSTVTFTCTSPSMHTSCELEAGNLCDLIACQVFGSHKNHKSCVQNNYKLLKLIKIYSSFSQGNSCLYSNQYFVFEYF